VRRKRKTRYTWLPTLDGTLFGSPQDEARSWQHFVLDVPVDGTFVLGLIPVVADLPQGTLSTVETEGMGEIIGNEYILKRIVGSVFCHLNLSNTSGSTAITITDLRKFYVAVTAGWFVARADQASLDTPIGSAETNAEQMYSPQVADLTRQPWIWRRTWILGLGNPSFGEGNLATSENIAGSESYPRNNIAYGSVRDGPHVDAKTGRRIRREERLFFAASACQVDNTALNSSLAPGVVMTVDTRYLGALRRAKSRSNF